MNNVDLISRSALLKIIKARHKRLENPNDAISIIVQNELSSVMDEINDAPTIDATPVVHGQWVWFENRPVVDDEDPECIGITGYECSECGNNDSTCIRFYEEPSVYLLSCIKEGLKESLTSYCPNCGAKMDTEEPTNE